AIVAGITGSTDFPTANPLQATNAGGIDAFVTKLNASGSGLVYSTYLGSAGTDGAWGVAVDGSGNAYVSGFLWIGGGPALLAKFSAAGALADSYSLSTAGRAGALGVALGSSGNVYLSGFNSFTTPDFTNCPLIATPELTPHHAFVAKVQVQATSSTNPLPAISSLSPAGATAGDAGFTLTVIGANFLPGSVVRWNGADRGTTYVSGSQLSATISANDIGTAGTANVTVYNPAPAGWLSNALGFVIGSAPQPALAVSPASLGLSATLGGPAATSALQVGSVGGAVSWTASTTILNGGAWLTVSPSSGTSTPAQPVLLALQANPAAPGAAGLFQAVITLTASAGKSVTVPVTLSVGQGRPRLRLSHTALVFSATQGAAAPPPQTVSIFNALPGSGTLNWSAAAASANWLSVSPGSGTASCASATSCSPGLAKMSVNAAGLAPGVYQAMVTVSAAEAGNTELLSVSLQVTAASATPTPSALLAPYGLFFTAAAGGSAPPAQSITVSNAGDGTLSFQLSVATFSGGNWLTVSPAAGDTTTGPVTASVSVSPAGLAQGVYRGRVVGVFNSGSPQEVDVMLAVGAGASGSFAVAPAAWNGAAAACAPQSMELMATTIGSGLNLQASFPRPLLVFLVDNCGTPVADATVVASVEGLNIVLQRLGAGWYSGTWVPSQISSAVVLKLTATHPSFSSVATQSFTLKVSTAPGNVQLPAILQDGIVEGAGFTPRRPLAPGGIISIFGTQLASGEAQASKLPLERELNGVSVRVGTLTAPLYYVGPDQINAQLPFEAAAADTVSIAVVTQGRITSPCAYAVAPAQPGIFRAGANAAVLDGQSRLVTPDNPARIGDVLQIFATGLGATDVAVQTGAPAPAFSTVRLPITATIGGVQATVVYQGLAPGFVGLYQVNVVVPEGATPGSAVPLVLRQNGLVSNPDSPITIPVQPR
ncbi:MAG: IPT/TIG domain-containing protein, partial [Acidobacteria bacterium]|nr:IPT/TIG domain-containing protein [Acidobacteriota bacterium]